MARDTAGTGRIRWLRLDKRFCVSATIPPQIVPDCLNDDKGLIAPLTWALETLYDRHSTRWADAAVAITGDTRRKSKPRIRPVRTISRFVGILRLLGDAPEPMTCKAIATALDMVPSSCLHILRVLVTEGLVVVDEESLRYALGSGMLSLARSVIERSGFAALVSPMLESLTRKWGITTAGVEIEDSGLMIVLAISRSRATFGLNVDVGSQFPPLLSATGQVFAAFGNQTKDELIKGFKSLQKHANVDRSSYEREVEWTRKRGYAIDREHISGLTIMAVPILNDTGKLTHALVGGGLSEQFGSTRLAALAKNMQQEAKRLATMMIALA